MFNAPLLGNGRCHGNRIVGNMSGEMMGCNHTSWDSVGRVFFREMLELHKPPSLPFLSFPSPSPPLLYPPLPFHPSPLPFHPFPSPSLSPPSPPPSSPFPSLFPPLPVPSLPLPLEVGPLIAARGSGGAL